MNRILFAWMLAALPAIAGCADTSETSNAFRDYSHPADVPVMAGFELKTREPIPTSETVGNFRRVVSAFSRLEAPGYNAVSAYYTSALIDHGWTHVNTAAEVSSTADRGQRWKTVWRKGKAQHLTLTYEERTVRLDERDRLVGEIRIGITGSQ